MYACSTVCVRDEWVTYLLAWKTLPPFCLPSHSKRPESWKTLARNLNGGHSFPPGPTESGKICGRGGDLRYPFLHRYVGRYGTKLHCPTPTELRNLCLLRPLGDLVSTVRYRYRTPEYQTYVWVLWCDTCRRFTRFVRSFLSTVLLRYFCRLIC